MGNLPSFISKRYDQVAFVVDDLDEACERYSKLLGLSNWNVWTDLAKGQSRKLYYGEPEEFQFSCAYAFSGEVLVELCRHDGGRSVYKDWLDTRGPGLNHIGFRLENDEEFEEAAWVFESQGAPFAMGGELDGAGRWSYFNTVDLIGVYTEIYWCAPAVLDIFERMKRGEQVELPR